MDIRHLTKRAILVKLRIGGWRDKVRDEKITKEVAERYNANTVDAGQYMKNLYNRDALADINRIGNDTGNLHRSLTMPWDDYGYRLLPIKIYHRYIECMNTLIEARIEARDEFSEMYPMYMKDARRRLGKMFNLADYLPETEIERRITMEYRFLPVPDAQQFVVDMNADVVSRIRMDIQVQTQEQVRGTVSDLYKRAGKNIRRCNQRLTPTENGKPKTFRDTLITNLDEVTTLIPLLNVTDDPMLTDLCSEVQTVIANVHPDELRVNHLSYSPVKHSRVKTTMEELLTEFEDYFDFEDTT